MSPCLSVSSLTDVLVQFFSIDLDFRKRWCTLENGSLSYFDSDKVVECFYCSCYKILLTRI